MTTEKTILSARYSLAPATSPPNVVQYVMQYMGMPMPAIADHLQTN